MSSVFITGCNRGLGLEFVKELLAHSNPPSVLIATCRNPEAADSLQSLARTHSNLHILKLDILDFDSYEAIAQKTRDLVGDRGLNVLINNAGIMRGLKNEMSQMNVKDLTDIYLTNTVAPIMLLKALRPLLKQAAERNQSSPMGWSRAAVVNITSILGSLASNTTGGYLEYRESKAALNMAARSWALELAPENILVFSIHPGWVQTDMGGKEALLTVEQSVSNMLRVLYGLKPEHHGTFAQYDGKELPW